MHGYFLSEIGLGESARLHHAAFRETTIPVSAKNHVLKGRQNETGFTDIVSEEAPFNIALSIFGLPEIRRWRRQMCRTKFNIALPFWELDVIPEKAVKHLRRLDRVWAASEFLFKTFKGNGLTNVDYLRHPLALPQSLPNFFDPGAQLKFLFYFDFDSFSARKNPEASIHAFKKAFPKQTDVSLTIKARGSRDAGRRAWLANQAAEDPRINVVDKVLSRDEMSDLVNQHDVFLSLHRSEGLGLGCAEALAAGRVVVATDYGGSTDFINGRTGYPVAWDRIDVGQEDYVHSEGASWADPSIEDASAQLRAIYDNPHVAKQKAQAGYDHLVANHSFAAVGRELEAILQRRGLMDTTS
ncbi:MAG: glycosyltransferase family 4 protein [Pseudomonadota bacterium]